MKTIKGFYNLYLKCNVVVLAVFENFRNNRLKNYGSCLSHYLSAPALIWDAMLNMTKVELGFISDPGMYLFFEKGMRDRVCYVSKVYSKSNNCLRSYEPKQESRHIIYLNTYNLYSYAISKFLSTYGFKWIDPKEFDLNKCSGSKVCLLKVDLEYPLASDKTNQKWNVA